jgi:hypothetical protein
MGAGENNFIGIGLGGGTPATTFTPSGTFTWGTVYEPTEKTLTLTADSGTLPAVCLLEFTGDTSGFECTEIEGQILAAPVEVGSLPLNVRYLSWEQGSAITLKFQPVFLDGTAKSVTLTIKGYDGSTVSTAAMSATYEDPVVGASNSAGTLLHLWDVSGIATGALSASDKAATDVINPTEANYQLYAEDTTKTVVAGALPGVGASPMLQKYINTTGSGPTRAVAPVAHNGTAQKAGWCIISKNFSDGKSGPGLSEATLSTGTGTYYWNVFASKVRYQDFGSTYVETGAISGVKSVFLAWRYNTSDNKTYFVVSDLEGTWGDLATDDHTGNIVEQLDAFAWQNSQTGADFNIQPGGRFSTEPTDAALEDIYDACKV